MVYMWLVNILFIGTFTSNLADSSRIVYWLLNMHGDFVLEYC